MTMWNKVVESGLAGSRLVPLKPLYAPSADFRLASVVRGMRRRDVSRQSPDAGGREVPAEAAGRVQAPGGRGLWTALLHHQRGWKTGAVVPNEGVGGD